jgi:hypothetical protein
MSSTIRAAGPNYAVRTCSTVDLVLNKRRCSGEHPRGRCEAGSLRRAAGSHRGLTGLGWEAAKRRGSPDGRHRGQCQHERRDARAPPPSQVLYVIPSSGAQRPPDPRLVVFATASKCNERAARAVSTYRCVRLGRGRFRGLALGHSGRGGPCLSAQPAVRPRDDSQRHVRSTSASETVSQSLCRAPSPAWIGAPPIEHQRGLRRGRRVGGGGLAAAAGDLPGQAFVLVPVVLSDLRTRAVRIEAEAANRRERRRLVRSASPTRVAVHESKDTLASMMSDSVNSALLRGTRTLWPNGRHLKSS